MPGFVLHPQPVGANDDQNYIACGDLAVQVRYEVDPGGDVVDIHKKIFSPKCLGQPIVNPTCRGGRIFAAVVDENCTIGFQPKDRTLTAAVVRSVYLLGSGATWQGSDLGRLAGRLVSRGIVNWIKLTRQQCEQPLGSTAFRREQH